MYHGGLRSRELCQAPISASVIITLAGVVGESVSFSTLQDWRPIVTLVINAKVAAPGFERETLLVIKRALASVATAADFVSNRIVSYCIIFL